MPRRKAANDTPMESSFLTVKQIAMDLACDRGMVYQLIERGELLGTKPFHDQGVLRVPRSSYDAYKSRIIEAAEEHARRDAPTEPERPLQKRVRPRVIVDSPEQRAAIAFFRARGGIQLTPAEQRLADTIGQQAQAPARPKPRIKADHAAHRAAVERMRARGIIP